MRTDTLITGASNFYENQQGWKPVGIFFSKTLKPLRVIKIINENTRGASKAKVAFLPYILYCGAHTHIHTLYIYVDTYVHMWSLMSRWRHHNILLATSYRDGCKKGQLDKEGKKERKWLVHAATCAIEIRKTLTFGFQGAARVSVEGRDLLSWLGHWESSVIWTTDGFELWRLPRENVCFWRNFWTICTRRCQCALLIRQRKKYNEQAVFDVSLAIYNLVVSSQ